LRLTRLRHSAQVIKAANCQMVFTQLAQLAPQEINNYFTLLLIEISYILSIVLAV
jgi:hypothetical protein